MVNGKSAAGYVLENWEVQSGKLGSEAFVWLRTPDGRISARVAAKDASPITALQKAVQMVVSVPVRVVQQTVLDQGKGGLSPVVNMVVMVGKPWVLGVATVHSPDILEASVNAFVGAINNAIARHPVVVAA